MRPKTCRSCRTSDLTVTFRERSGALLCPACNVDANNWTSTRKVDHKPAPAPVDRYTLLAARYGL